MSVQAKVIRDSLHPSGDPEGRLTTLEVTMHRFVLAEFNTHRVFSRNSASSRAIPVTIQLEKLRTDPAIPVEFGTNKPGMQAGEPLAGEELEAAEATWLSARTFAVNCAEELLNQGVHKQVANRLLEPFMWHTVIVTATNWDGFWKQRVSALAQPEIRTAAEAMLEVYRASTPTVPFSDWHLPYIQDDEWDHPLEELKAVSAARCARVSYLTHDGIRDWSKDLDLFEFLISADPPHASPLEHVATPAWNYAWGNAEPYKGNLCGWNQLRHNYWPDY